ncbi:MAG: hypothetical protein R2736_20455 [Solirubrobacterales bacterium]
MRSYRPEELFDEGGALRANLAALAPEGDRRMGVHRQPHANGGIRLRGLELPDFLATPSTCRSPHARRPRRRACSGPGCATSPASTTTAWIMGPDETRSNRGAVFEVTSRAWMAETEPTDDHLAPDGRVMEVLSEHLCQGWLEGYLLTGRHGLFSCYEAFIHIVATRCSTSTRSG